MMRDPIALLKSEAKRKPALAALLNRAETLSDDEIEQAPYLKWIKGALKTVREKARAQARITTTESSIEKFLTLTLKADSEGEAFIWAATDRFVRFGKSELLIPRDALLWKSEGFLWYEYSRSSNLNALHTNAVSIGKMMRTQYLIKCREKTNSNIRISVPKFSMAK